jgi:hypothetical protein
VIKREKIFLWFGLALVLAALLGNEFLLAALFSRDGVLEERSAALIRIGEGMLIVLGFCTVLFRRAGWLVNIYLLSISLLLVLLGFEIYLRVPGIIKKIHIGRVRCQDEYLHHSLRPNVAAPLRWGDAEPMYYTNSLGYRDRQCREVPLRSESATRMLVLGDSFAECIGVEYEAGFIHKLEQLMRAAGRDVEILNAGVGSYCPSLEYRKLKQFLESGYQTDEVILLLDPADVHDEAVEYLGWEKKGPDEPLAGGLDLYPRIIIELRQRLAPPAGSRTEPARASRLDWFEYDVPVAWVQKGISICQEHIRKIAALCDQHSIRFILVLYPYPGQILSGNRPSIYQQNFSEFARQNGIEVVDISPAFFELEDWDTYFIPGDIHWNERGHTLVARELFKRFEILGRNPPND